MGMNWGVVNAGMQDSLENILARRDKSTQLVTQLMQEAQQQKMQEAHLALATKREAADEGLRRDTLASNDAYRKTMAADRERGDAIRDEGVFHNRLKILPKGTALRKTDIGDFEKYGAMPLLKPAGADTDTQEDHFHFAGTESADEAGAKLEQQRQAAESANQARLGQLSAAQAHAELARQQLEFQKTRKGTPQVLRGADGTDHMFQIGQDGRAVEVVLPPGMHKNKTAEEMANEDALRTTARFKAKNDAAPTTGIVQTAKDVYAAVTGKGGAMQPAVSHAPTPSAPKARRPIPGIPDAEAEEVAPGRWVRVK